MRRLGFLLAFLAFAGVMNAPAGAEQDPKNELVQIEREWNEALRTKNVAWFEEHLAADVTDIA